VLAAEQAKCRPRVADGAARALADVGQTQPLVMDAPGVPAATPDGESVIYNDELRAVQNRPEVVARLATDVTDSLKPAETKEKNADTRLESITNTDPHTLLFSYPLGTDERSSTPLLRQRARCPPHRDVVTAEREEVTAHSRRAGCGSLGLAAVGVASAANNTGASASICCPAQERGQADGTLSTSGSVTFAPGDLTEGVTLRRPGVGTESVRAAQDLDAAGGPAREDVYGISQAIFVVRGSGGQHLRRHRSAAVALIDSDGTTVVELGRGVGFTGPPLDPRDRIGGQHQTVRVQSGRCTTDCGR
jgi:hypothetical protein